MVYETLQKIQTELKAPKNLRNTFGGYNYRNAEGILEALKPILAKYNSTLVITDEINEIGGRIYVTATAIFRDAEGQATSASASVPCTVQASSMDSPLEWGQPRQCIPISKKKRAVSTSKSSTSPIKVSLVTFMGVPFSVRILAHLHI